MDVAREVVALQATTVEQYTPVVARLISSDNRDCQEIQHVLDRLLDVACHPEGLTCRYYYGLDPEGAAFYVMFYRELWDTEEGDHGHRE